MALCDRSYVFRLVVALQKWLWLLHMNILTRAVNTESWLWIRHCTLYICIFIMCALSTWRMLGNIPGKVSVGRLHFSSKKMVLLKQQFFSMIYKIADATQLQAFTSINTTAWQYLIFFPHSNSREIPIIPPCWIMTWHFRILFWPC